MRFIGLDLAWSSKNGTGASAIEGDERAGRLVASGLLRGDEEVVDFVRAHAGVGSDAPVIVAVDAPLRVPNDDGRRPAEAEIGRMFARYHAGAHPANRRRLAPLGVVRGEALVERLTELGFVDRPEVAALTPVRQVVEVYPHPAMVSIFGLDRILKYKARRTIPVDARLAAFGRYHELLGSLATADPGLHGADDLLGRELTGLRRTELKDHEDRLDGLMCAYIAHYLWRWGMARARVFGSLERGYITSPVPREHWARHADAPGQGL